MTDFTPNEPVFTPIKDHAEELAKAEAGVADFAAKRNNRWYPKFHIASNGGWINDPNGLCYYQGRWHVFYQLHPYGTQWGPMHWGHVSSTDMVNWKREPIMFAPSLEQEKDGVFSGSAVIGDDGKLKFYYTGHRWANGHDDTGGDWQVQMLAEPDNDELTSATKRGMVIDCPTDKVDHHYRDPKVWKTGDKWYMTFGVSSAEKRGQMWLFSSDDMVRWTYERVLFEHPDPNVFMLECPDFFPIRDTEGNEKWVIGFSAMGAKASGFMNRNVNNAGYMIGTWTPGEAFIPLVLRGYWISMHAHDRFGALLSAGLTTLIGLQVLLNIGVVTNLLPSTGISLPFFSYGGTALLVNLAEMGMILSVSRQNTNRMVVKRRKKRRRAG